MLLREAQAEKDPAPPPAASANPGEAEWSQLVAVIRERAQQPGVNNELTTQIGSVLDMLRALCWKLPGGPPAASAAAPAATPAALGKPAATSAVNGPSTQPAPGPASEAEANARAAAREIAQQISRDMAASAEARRQLQPPQQQPAPREEAPSHPVFLAVGGNAAAQQQSGQPPTQPSDSQAASSSGGQGAPEASEVVAQPGGGAAAATPPVLAIEASEETGYDSLDDVSSVNEDEEMRLFDDSLSGLSEEQKAKVREVLDKRRVRVAQRRSGPKQLKKAGKFREAASDAFQSKKHYK